jgi:hypothetical protein
MQVSRLIARSLARVRLQLERRTTDASAESHTAARTGGRHLAGTVV